MAQVVDWQAYHTLIRIVVIMQEHPGYICIYNPREENNQAHLLANWARREKLDYEGYTYPLISYCNIESRGY